MLLAIPMHMKVYTGAEGAAQKISVLASPSHVKLYTGAEGAAEE